MIPINIIFLLLDVSSKSFYEPIPVIEFAAKFLNLEDPSIMARMPLSNDDRLKVLLVKGAWEVLQFLLMFYLIFPISVLFHPKYLFLK